MNKKNIIEDLKDYMFTSNNMNKYSKYIIQINKPKQPTIYIEKALEEKKKEEKVIEKKEEKIVEKKKEEEKKVIEKKKKEETTYMPKQKDSLFWCFYILKKGISNYEMEISGQYFVVEKNEKYKYIETLRKKKDILKIHKIKPFTELEDDLANKKQISIKTFFALCVLENINVLFISNRKVYELLVDERQPINVVHRNKETEEHFIELEPTDDSIKKYRETYYKMNSFDKGIKSIGSYKLDELIELCNRLNIKINKCQGKRPTKKEIYELLVMNF